MKQFHKMILFTFPLICLLGCGQDVSTSQPFATSSSAASAAVEKEDSFASRDYQEKLKQVDEDQAEFGIKYLGFIDASKDMHVSDLMMENQFEWLIANDSIVTLEENEVYAIIPNSYVKAIEVYQNTWINEQDKNQLITTLHEAKPFLVVDNQSELRPDIVIKLIHEDGRKVSFSPYISLKDGKVAIDSKDENLKWLDFTNLDLN